MFAATFQLGFELVKQTSVSGASLSTLIPNVSVFSHQFSSFWAMAAEG
jgi:hypothetical protein